MKAKKLLEYLDYGLSTSQAYKFHKDGIEPILAHAILGELKKLSVK